MISFENVSKSVGARRLLNDVSFAVPRGRITGFVGPNGAGKSTTMRVALGLTSAQTGRVLFNGRPYRSGAGHAGASTVLPYPGPRGRRPAHPPGMGVGMPGRGCRRASRDAVEIRA